MNIWQIEITNKCNMTCDYCPRTQLMTRELGVMSYETIDRIAEIITSKRVRLHHYGETLLALPQALHAIKVFSERGVRTVINTNGSACTTRRVRELFSAGLEQLVIGLHPLKHRVGSTAKNSLTKQDREPASETHLYDLAHSLSRSELGRIEIIKVASDEEYEQAEKELKYLSQFGFNCSVKRKRNLGQVFGINKDPAVPNYCSFLQKNEFAVLWNGDIVSCCEVYDARPEWILGNVHDENVVSRLTENPGCSLCLGCLGYGGDEQETEKTSVSK